MQRQQFYPSVVYITKSNPSMAVIYLQVSVKTVEYNVVDPDYGNYGTHSLKGTPPSSGRLCRTREMYKEGRDVNQSFSSDDRPKGGGR